MKCDSCLSRANAIPFVMCSWALAQVDSFIKVEQSKCGGHLWLPVYFLSAS